MLVLARSALSGLALALGIGAILVTLSSCSSSAGSSPSVILGQAPTPTATVIGSSPTQSPGGAVVTNCQTSQLTLAKQGDENGLGNFANIYRLQNTSQQTCTLEGYPGVQLLDENQQPMSITVLQQTSAYLYNTQTVQLVTLAPGASGYFILEWSAGPGSCTGAASVLVTPPGDQTSLQFANTIQACTGKVIVSPIEPAAFT
jgi:Protein of unknown function (DUF4232)